MNYLSFKIDLDENCQERLSRIRAYVNEFQKNVPSVRAFSYVGEDSVSYCVYTLNSNDVELIALMDSYIKFKLQV